MRERGFTIIELLMVIVILAILGALTAPSMQEFVRAAAIRGASSDFYGALSTARSEAIKRRASISVIPTNGTAWTGGWIVQPSAGGNTLQATDVLTSDVGVTPAAANIVFGPNGRVSSGSGTVVFYSLSTTSIQARCVVVDVNGLPRIRTDTNKNHSDGCN